MQRTCEMIGTPAPVAAILHLVENYEEQVNSLVNDDEDLVEYVERLETATDSGMILSDEVNDDQLQLEFTNDASDEEAAEFVDEVERFLREQNTD
jgi:hypothetical protein